MTHLLLAMIGIIGAMPEEVSQLTEEMQDRKEIQVGVRTYHVGSLYGRATVIAYPCVGKVASASVASTLIHHFNVDRVFFCGMAGAAKLGLRIGDIVVAEQLVQHDLDARPFFKQFEVPFMNKTHFFADPMYVREAMRSACQFFHQDLHQMIEPELIETFALQAPTVHMGVIASGDQFIADARKINEICGLLPGTLCVEMEGAAVAQICYENKIPFLVYRVISDLADHSAPIDFFKFANCVANTYSKGLIRQLYKNMP